MDDVPTLRWVERSIGDLVDLLHTRLGEHDQLNALLSDTTNALDYDLYLKAELRNCDGMIGELRRELAARGAW